MAKTQSAQLNYLKIAPRKVRLVVGGLKGLTVNEAEAFLLSNHKRPAESILKLLRSAVANAKSSKSIDADKLRVKEVRVDEGPTMKRFMPRAMGRATTIRKRSSHITLILSESDKSKETRFKIVKKEKISKAKVEKMKKDKEKETPREKEESKRANPKQTGFMKRMFRRKAV